MPNISGARVTRDRYSGLGSVWQMLYGRLEELSTPGMMCPCLALAVSACMCVVRCSGTYSCLFLIKSLRCKRGLGSVWQMVHAGKKIADLIICYGAMYVQCSKQGLGGASVQRLRERLGLRKASWQAGQLQVVGAWKASVESKG